MREKFHLNFSILIHIKKVKLDETDLWKRLHLCNNNNHHHHHCYGAHCNSLLRDLRHCHDGSIPLCFAVVSLRVVGVIFHSV